ncbi:hypothetical protein TD95_001650 [Thielaviopsis punctulata]|uniref:Double-strand break repair protein n=1 Tax=Thielaviopsis punctulata TaxID=72032 RepID=A0A0F4Z8K1_9PEZI|nr:hypothetical protein TD95_001650 [Thielaviopsis punctulata]
MSRSPENTIRILVATDNHVGYEERDPIRKDDSWKTFDEIMTLARTQDVDMVLLAGDLFHDNKPSRKSLFEVMRSLRRNCLGMKPCELEFLSDARQVFGAAAQTVNYEDEDINIAIPVFSIHGNHDDPSGDGHLCSLDLLQAAGLVNYFGRVAEADNIEARPVLLQKGSTRLALYGLSNVRDERMFRTFRDHKVTWFRPSNDDGGPGDGAGAGSSGHGWFNLLALHQNHHAHTATSYLPETALPDWLQLVVWGHEHECLIDPRRNPETGFHVMQPGSSVATSLCPGEAVAKHVAVVSVTGREFFVEKLALKSVRPFVMREISLSADRRFRGLDRPGAKTDTRTEITKRLMAVVDEMIGQAEEEWRETHGVDEEMPLPLIRLKVEYSPSEEGGSFDVENPQRFSNRFVGRVANTSDVVLFHRKKSAVKSQKAKADVPETVAATAADTAIKVDVLVQKFLQAQSLKILPQVPFGDAVNQFVSKDDKHAMEHFVSESLAGQVQQMLALDSDDDDLDTAMEAYRARLDEKFAQGAWKPGPAKRYRERPAGWDSDLDGRWEDQPQALLGGPPGEEEEEGSGGGDGEGGQMQGKKRGARNARTVAKTTVAKTTVAKKTPAPRGRAKKTVALEKEQEEEEEEEEDGIVANDLDDDFEMPAPRSTRGRGTRVSTTTTAATTKKGTAKQQSTLNFSQRRTGSARAAAVSKKPVVEISDDDIEDDEDFDDGFEPARRKR